MTGYESKVVHADTLKVISHFQSTSSLLVMHLFLHHLAGPISFAAQCMCVYACACACACDIDIYGSMYMAGGRQLYKYTKPYVLVQCLVAKQFWPTLKTTSRFVTKKA